MIALQFPQSDTRAAKGLCIEFILHEFAKALTMTEKLASASPADTLAILEKMFRDSLNTDILQEAGIIDKLCFYCEALVQNSKIGEHLLDAIDELRNITSKPRAALARQLRSAADCSSHSIYDLLQILTQSLRAFFSLLIPVLQTCLECETTLFTLLELRKTLNRHLGEKTVETLFQQFFPEGPHLLRQALTNGYSRRGFSDFCQRHEVLFEGLVWPLSKEPCDLKL